MVDLRVSITDSSLCVSLRDHCVCDGRQAGEAHGLGLPMMRLLMDGVEVQTGADITTVIDESLHAPSTLEPPAV